MDTSIHLFEGSKNKINNFNSLSAGVSKEINQVIPLSKSGSHLVIVVSPGGYVNGNLVR
jgi:phage replication-related protein YjqB (UPF0714/DUF867 family)